MRSQHTIADTVSCSGVGLHTGQPVTLTLRPAPPDTGIVFLISNGSSYTALGASVENLTSTELCTAISGQGSEVKTIEHILAALAGLEVDNVYIELDAGEVPVMDGSAGPFVQMVRAAGIIPQHRPQPFLKITQPIEVVDGSKRIRIEPSATPRITYSIQYSHPLIQTQSYSYDHSVLAFERDIAGARTFGFLHEVEALWSRGLAKGGSLDNTIVLTHDGILNTSGLRYQDEFVRHKVLDLIGDIALLGVPFIGHLIAERSGHALHTKLVEHILRQPDKWVLLNLHESDASASRPVANVTRPAYGLAVHASPIQ
ncbi:MAG TPA: UDP-3-O-acyl-N-acetylglucosamine deacetylase [Nitrospiraceae bacterium]|jgi:UDP-3-O-[3-hydroxymyristoyl] N-acetylglucosamine deacetylase|nr:UDP-3-O-acyl-N-acetylglucosamine deacetylase [Nitrospiraceae bacterium]